MNGVRGYKQSKVLIGLLSMLFLVSPSFETNVQNCEMIRVIQKKSKDGDLADEDFKEQDNTRQIV